MQSVQLCMAMAELMLCNCVTQKHVTLKPLVLLSHADNGRYLLSILNKDTHIKKKKKKGLHSNCGKY